MICFTGDVHHDTLKTNEQLFLQRQDDRASEVEVTRKYVRLCEHHGVKCTLYVTGKTLAHQWEAFRPAAESDMVEIGGHTYAALPRPWYAQVLARLTGNISSSHADSHGSRRAQRRDVHRMCAVARKRLSRPIRSWRGHGLVHDRHTYEILAAEGIQTISDDLDWEKLRPEHLPSGLVSLPLNVMMDHDHLYHAHRTRDYVARQQAQWPWPDAPTSESYDIEAWGDMVEEQIDHIDSAGGLAVVLMHPICMYVADGFATFERLLKQFSDRETIWAEEAVALCTQISRQGEAACRQPETPEDQ